MRQSVQQPKEDACGSEDEREADCDGTPEHLLAEGFVIEFAGVGGGSVHAVEEVQRQEKYDCG